MRDLVFDIGPDGVVRYIHDDEAVRIARGLGTPRITRASHVEYDNERGGWTADMSPLGSDVVLGPFPTRDEALEREHTWLTAHMPALLREQGHATPPGGSP
jgi:hypothetical protein